MTPLHRQWIEAGLVVLGSPVYWWSDSAQLKVFIDRRYGLNYAQHPGCFKGKKLDLVLTHQEEHPCSGAELARKMFEEIADYANMTIVGDLRYSSDTCHVRERPRNARKLESLA